MFEDVKYGVGRLLDWLRLGRGEPKETIALRREVAGATVTFSMRAPRGLDPGRATIRGVLPWAWPDGLELTSTEDPEQRLGVMLGDASFDRDFEVIGGPIEALWVLTPGRRAGLMRALHEARRTKERIVLRVRDGVFELHMLLGVRDRLRTHAIFDALGLVFAPAPTGDPVEALLERARSTVEPEAQRMRTLELVARHAQGSKALTAFVERGVSDEERIVLMTQGLYGAEARWESLTRVADTHTDPIWRQRAIEGLAAQFMARALGAEELAPRTRFALFDAARAQAHLARDASPEALALASPTKALRQYAAKRIAQDANLAEIDRVAAELMPELGERETLALAQHVLAHATVAHRRALLALLASRALDPFSRVRAAEKLAQGRVTEAIGVIQSVMRELAEHPEARPGRHIEALHRHLTSLGGSAHASARGLLSVADVGAAGALSVATGGSGALTEVEEHAKS